MSLPPGSPAGLPVNNSTDAENNIIEASQPETETLSKRKREEDDIDGNEDFSDIHDECEDSDDEDMLFIPDQRYIAPDGADEEDSEGDEDCITPTTRRSKTETKLNCTTTTRTLRLFPTALFTI